jgi:hypothetical protein
LSLFIIVCAVSLFTAGCGKTAETSDSGGNSGSGSPPAVPPVTPAQTYTLTITAGSDHLLIYNGENILPRPNPALQDIYTITENEIVRLVSTYQGSQTLNKYIGGGRSRNGYKLLKIQVTTANTKEYRTYYPNRNIFITTNYNTVIQTGETTALGTDILPGQIEILN